MVYVDIIQYKRWCEFASAYHDNSTAKDDDDYAVGVVIGGGVGGGV